MRCRRSVQRPQAGPWVIGAGKLGMVDALQCKLCINAAQLQGLLSASTQVSGIDI